MAITISKTNQFLTQWSIRGQQVANNTLALLSLINATPQVDLTNLASAVLVVAQAYAASQQLACTILVQDANFSTFSKLEQEQVWLAFEAWNELFAFLASLAVNTNYIALDSIVSASTNAKLFGAKTANPAAINAKLEAILSAHTIAGININTFYSISTQAREELVSLASVDWSLSTSPSVFGYASTDAILTTALDILTNAAPNQINVPALVNQVNNAVLQGLSQKQPFQVRAITVPTKATVESLALQYTGNADNWREIVQLNNLIYPYITNNAVEALGVPFITTTLSQSVSSGTSITIGNTQGIEQNYIVLLTSGATQQQLTVQSVGIGGQITTEQAVANSFTTTFTTVKVYRSNADQGNILTTGDTILIPVSQNVKTNSVITNNTTDPLIYGIDIQIDSQGNLHASNGDLATVSGLNNISQAIYNRLKTPINSVVMHPEYGSVLSLFIGLGNSTKNAFIAQANVTQTLISDPRIASADVSQASVNGDILTIDVTTTLIDGTKFSPNRLDVPINFGN